jgi:hypothetical protein
MCVEQGENCRIGAGSALLSERITSYGSSSNKVNVSVLRVFSCTSSCWRRVVDVAVACPWCAVGW